MRPAKLFAAIAFAASLTPVAAYYHYSYYTPAGVIQEKFDLAQLPNRTVTFFVADPGSLEYGPNDSFPSVLSQIRQAALAWNVPQSELRVAFGGMTEQPPQATPHGLVVFEDIPPGWLAYSTRTVVEPQAGQPAAFVPIVQGRVHLNRNLQQKPAPSYLEAFFTTVVHEMGHALGLQHTYTSSAMSTAVTRATTRLQPIEADDVAALAVLYPNRSVAGSYGSITGRVTVGGQGVHLASVVAMRPAGSSVSTLTNPDGTYRIDWLPPDSYWVYVHPLPPNPDIQWPKDATGRALEPGEPFETLFYPGTRDPRQFAPLLVARGSSQSGIDFSVQRRTASQPIYDVVTYSYIGQTGITPAHLDISAPMGTMVARGAGLLGVDGRAAAGLGVQILGALGNNIYAMQAYEGNLAVYFDRFQPFSGTGRRHILFTQPNDAYVLPAGVTLVNRRAPVVTGVNPNPDGAVTVTGTGLNTESRVYFDGVAATIRTPFSGSEQSGSVVVAPPPGFSQQTASVAVYNSDGQNSLFTQAANPPTYQYPAAETALATVTPNALPAGVSAMVEVNGVGSNFVDGLTTVGLGTSDAHVRRIWILSPTRLIANVTVAPNAPAGASLLTVLSGFQTFRQPLAFQVQPPNPRLPVITLPAQNANPSQSAIFPGAAVSLYGANLAAFPNGAAITLNDQPAQVLFASAGQVNFVVPASVRTGPAILRLSNGVESALPVVVQIDAPPPQVNAVLSSSSSPFDAARPALAGDVLNLLLGNLDPSVTTAPSRVRVNVGGTEMPALVVVPAPNQPGVWIAQIILAPTTTGTQVPVTVTVDGGAASAPFFIPVR